MITFRSYTLSSEVIITLHFSLLTLHFARRKRFLEAREIDGYLGYPGYPTCFYFQISTSTLLPKVELILNLEIIQRQLEIVLCREAGVSQIAVYAAHGKPRLLAVGGVCLEYDSQCCASYRQVLIQNSGANITFFCRCRQIICPKMLFSSPTNGQT